MKLETKATIGLVALMGISIAAIAPKIIYVESSTTATEPRTLEITVDVPIFAPSTKLPPTPSREPTGDKGLDAIIASGFSIVRKNVDRLEDAQFVGLGETHLISEDNISMALPMILRTVDDIFCVEASPEYNGEKPIRHHLVYDPMSFVSLQSLKGYVRPERALGYVVFADAPSEIKYQIPVHLVQSTHLLAAKHYLNKNEPLHPFWNWLITTDLDISDNKDPVKTIAAIDSYIESMPSDKEISFVRQKYITCNIVNETIDLLQRNPNSVTVGNFGSAHFDDYFIQALEDAKISYVIFKTYEEHGKPMEVFGNLADQKQANVAHSPNEVTSIHTANHLVPWYITIRKKQTGKSYEGTLDGLTAKMTGYFDAADEEVLKKARDAHPGPLWLRVTK